MLEDSPGEKGRVRVRVSLTPELSNCLSLPWELAWVDFPGGFADFLGRIPGVDLVRQTKTWSVGAYPNEPMRILVVWSDPAVPGYPALSHREQEAQAVREIFAELLPSSSVRELRRATPGGLEREIAEWRPHILHFIGHGGSAPTGGFLVMEGSETGETRLLKGEPLSRWLQKTPIRLVTLSACWTNSPGKSVCLELSQSGIPAVLAMQLPWRDSVGERFARAFYGSLIENGSLELALNEGRSSVSGTGLDWAVPTLYLSEESRTLFPETKSFCPGAKAHFNLPFPANPYFFGREERLLEIRKLFFESRSPTTPVFLEGVSGIGKSALASEYAHQFRSSFPGGIFWLDATSSDTLESSLVEIGRRRFSASITETDTADEIARHVCLKIGEAVKTTLIVLDNLSALPESDLVPRGDSIRILCSTQSKETSRSLLSALEATEWDGAYPEDSQSTSKHSLSRLALDEEPAIKLLQSFRFAPEEASAEAATAIWALVGGHPGALECIGKYLRDRQIDLKEGMILLKSNPETMLNPIFHRFDSEWRSLNDREKRLLSLLSSYGAQSLKEALVRDFAPDDDDFRRLEDLSILRWEAGERIQIDRLWHLYIRSNHPAADSEVCDIVSVLVRWMTPFRKNMEWEVIENEIAHIHSILNLCRKRKLLDCLPPLLREFGIFLEVRMGMGAGLVLMNEGLTIVQDRDAAEEAQFHRLLAEEFNDEEKYDEAIVSIAKAFEKASHAYWNEALEMADFHNSHGLILKIQGQFLKRPEFFPAALAHYLKADQLIQKHGAALSVDDVANRNNLAMLYFEMKDRQSALRRLCSNLELLKTIYPQRVHFMAGVINNNIGHILFDDGEFEKAFRSHQEALIVYKTLYGQEHSDIAFTLLKCGKCQRSLGRIEDAKYLFRESLRQHLATEGAEHRNVRALREWLKELDGVVS